MAAARPAGAARQSEEQGGAEAGKRLRPQSPGQTPNRAGIGWAALGPQSWTTAGGERDSPQGQKPVSAGAQLVLSCTQHWLMNLWGMSGSEKPEEQIS